MRVFVEMNFLTRTDCLIISYIKRADSYCNCSIHSSTDGFNVALKLSSLLPVRADVKQVLYFIITEILF